jgi:hypothetical protein
MRYLAPATDVHDALDPVTIPFVGKAAPVPRKAPARETDSSLKGRTAQLAAEVLRAERVVPSDNNLSGVAIADHVGTAGRHRTRTRVQVEGPASCRAGKPRT